MLQETLKKLSIEPKKLFLIDGLGALVSAFLLGVILVQLESIFGIPRNTLYFLAFLPCLFAVYDFYSYHRIEKNIDSFLKGIAIINLIYCCISIGLAFYHHQSITYLGWGYIILEILIVIVLVYIEWEVAARIKSGD